MSEFDFTKLKRGDRVKSRGGDDVEILVTDAKHTRGDGREYPIIGLVTEKWGATSLRSYTCDGLHHDQYSLSGHDLLSPKRKATYWVAWFGDGAPVAAGSVQTLRGIESISNQTIIAITGPHEIEEGQGM